MKKDNLGEKTYSVRVYVGPRNRREEIFQKNENERFLIINLWVEIKKILLTDKKCREIVKPSGHSMGIRYSLSATQVERGGLITSAHRALGRELPESKY